MSESIPRKVRRARLKKVKQTFTDRVRVAMALNKPVTDITWNLQKPPVVSA